MTRSRIVLFSLAWAFTAPSLALAFTGQADPDRQRSPQVREKVTVTATRLQEPIESVGSSVTVISAEEIRASGAHWLMDVLARVPGVTVARTGGPGAVTSVFTRGTDSNHTLVLIDGLKANSPTTAAFDWAYLPASSVQRVEIIRGPQSTLYGSDAIGGVINVITRAAGGAPVAELSVDAGSYATAHVQGSVQGGGTSDKQGTRFGLGFDYLDTDNFSAADRRAGNSERDGFRSGAVNGRVGHRWASGLDIEAFATGVKGRTRFDGFDFELGPADALAAVTDARSLFGGVRSRYGAGVWAGQLTLSTSDARLDTEDPDGFTTASTITNVVSEIDFQNDFFIDPDNTSVLGIEYRRERAESIGESAFGASGFDERVRIFGIYAQHRLTLGDRVHLSAGARHEDHDQFGGKTTYRLTGAYVAPAGLRLHGSVGTGFRAPNFNELYLPTFGNGALGPEESLGWDLGIGGAWLDDRLDADVTYFSNDLDGLIEFTFPAGFVNLGEARTRGVEVVLGAVPHRVVRLDATYTYLHARTVGSDEQLLRRPRHQWGLSTRVTPRRNVSVFTELRHKGARNDFGLLDVIELPAYTVWNAGTQVRLTDEFQILGRLDNITDSRYQEVWGFGTPGISGYLGLRYRWSVR